MVASRMSSRWFLVEIPINPTNPHGIRWVSPLFHQQLGQLFINDFTKARNGLISGLGETGLVGYSCLFNMNIHVQLSTYLNIINMYIYMYIWYNMIIYDMIWYDMIYDIWYMRTDTWYMIYDGKSKHHVPNHQAVIYLHLQWNSIITSQILLIILWEIDHPMGYLQPNHQADMIWYDIPSGYLTVCHGIDGP
jgi:hypothetical protein